MPFKLKHTVNLNEIRLAVMVNGTQLVSLLCLELFALFQST